MVQFLDSKKVSRCYLFIIFSLSTSKLINYHHKYTQDSGESFVTSYELNDTVYAKAEITPGKTVYLWLGANVMLEYTIEEAVKLLQERLDTAKKTLKTCEEDLEFLRENITTMEVNTARVYNWDVQKRRELKLKEEGKQ